MREAVILLHGLGRTKNSMNKIENYFKKEYDVYNIGYKSLKYPIEILVEKYLLETVNELNEKGQKINFITHSMGGILVRYLFKTYEIKNPGRVVMLAPPNKGSELANRFYKIHGPACAQIMRSRNSFVNRLGEINFECGIIAGGRNYYFFLDRYFKGKKNDGIVSVDSTRIKGEKSFIELKNGHTMIMYSNEAIKKIEHFIKYGKFLGR
jgi:triacylglycerol lipase